MLIVFLCRHLKALQARIMPSPPETFRFAVENETPETMPLDLMVRLLGELSPLLGEGKHLHLSGVERGSCAAVIQIDNGYEGTVKNNVEDIITGNLSKKLKNNIKKINNILADNKLKARIDGPVVSNKRSAVYLFPGLRKKQHDDFTIKEMMELQGEIVSISKNSKEEITADILSPIHGRVKASVNHNNFRKIAKNLFKQVRLYGIATQILSITGEGKIDNFTIKSVDELKDTPISSLLEDSSAFFEDFPDDLAEQIISERNEP